MLLTDLRTATKSLIKTPLLTIAALITLGLSISGTSVVFGVVDAFILKPLPFPQPENIMLLWQSRLENSSDLDDTAPANFVDWHRGAHSFTYLAAYTGTTYDLTDEGFPAEVAGAQVTDGFFESLGVLPSLGRGFTSEETANRGDHVAVISNNLWVQRFGASRSVLGKHVLLSGASYVIVGVMPPGWYLLGGTDVWTPLAWDPNDLKRDDHYLSVVGRLRPDVSISAARQEMNRLSGQLAHDYPEANTGYGVTIKPVGDVFPAQHDRRLMVILIGIVGFVLLIACANITNLQLAKASGRMLEIATRSALGASRGALVQQQIVESLVLAVCGGLMAMILTAIELNLLKANFFLSDSWNPLGFDLSVFLFTFAIAVVAGLISGILPALRGSRPDLNQMLQQGGRSGSQGRSFWLLGRVLVAVEVMLAVALLSVGGDMIVSFIKLRNQSPGFDATHLLTARISLPSARYGASQFSKEQQVTTILDRMAESIASSPGVKAVAYTTVLPRSESDPKAHFYRNDQPKALGGEASIASWRAVSANYFDVMKIPVLQGRSFNDQDLFGKEPVVIINQTLAKAVFPGSDPVGRLIVLFDEPRVIVGVAGDVLLNRSNIAPECIYLPHNQSPRLSVNFVVRTQANPLTLASDLPRKVWAVDPQQPVSRIVSFDEYADLQFSGKRLTVHLLFALCILAVVLATVGLFGLVNYLVTQRSSDYAVRMALGAQRPGIFRLVVAEAVKAIIPGAVAGVIVVLVIRAALSAYFDGILQSGWLFTLLVSTLLSATVVLASIWPALRASFVDLVILRREG